MPKYIEVESLLKTAKKLSKGVFSTPLIVAAIENAPKADVVEVVRCKDCLYKNEWANDGSYPLYNFCKHSGLWHLTDNHFCSYGEKKEGAN
jgi:hypothetical protein